MAERGLLGVDVLERDWFLDQTAAAPAFRGHRRGHGHGVGTFLRHPGKKLRLEDHDPHATPGFDGDKEAGRTALAKLTARLEELQEAFYAQGKHRLLVALQAMDAGGKDGTIRSVFDGVNASLPPARRPPRAPPIAPRSRSKSAC